MNSDTQGTPRLTGHTATPTIHGYHAHVYYDAGSFAQARDLTAAVAERFGNQVRLGRMHEKPVGPHPDWSCQIGFKPELFGDIMPWLAMHRGGLVLFIHPLSDNELRDHTERAIWLGGIRTLDTSMLKDGPTEPDV
jgi:DOPA 4,5-dioxygenase